MTLKTFKKKVVTWLGPWLAYWAIRVLGLTMRFEAVNLDIPRSILEKGQVAIGAFWHGRLLMMPFAYKHKGLKVSFLVSPHRDGQIVGKALQRFVLIFYYIYSLFYLYYKIKKFRRDYGVFRRISRYSRLFAISQKN